MRRHAAVVLIAFAAATSAIGFQVSPVSAECPFLPPWPEISRAIPTAREIVVGEIVADFRQDDLLRRTSKNPRDIALRVTHVLRGGVQPGDLLDIQGLQANWPQASFTGASGPFGSCTPLRAAPGEVIALAFDALHPGGRMRNGDHVWIQPPTRYIAVGVIEGPSGSRDSMVYRERVTLSQLRYLAKLPQTDTANPLPRGSVPADPAAATVLLIASLIGLELGRRRFGARAQVAQRVAPSGVRQSER